MADFNIRSEAVDVEQIMKQIRARIREKRGVDYTEEQVRELATVRLEKFLDPKNLRSDLLEQFRRSRPAVAAEPPPVEAPYEFTDQTLFETHRGALRFIRRLLKPILKLFFNPNPLINVLHTQAQFNVDLLKREQRRKIEFDRSRAEWNALYYEVLHNLVLETTRSSIEIKNLKMRVEALASRLDFSERRVRALEGVVQYRPEVLRPRPAGVGRSEPADTDAAPGDGAEALGPLQQTGEGLRRRRRRRRSRRGSPGPTAPGMPVDVEENGPDETDADEADAAAATGAAPTEAGATGAGSTSADAAEPGATGGGTAELPGDTTRPAEAGAAPQAGDDTQPRPPRDTAPADGASNADDQQ